MPPPTSHIVDSSDFEIIRVRNYQLEMLQQSLNRNVIIAMDTGSGKTEIAVMRIRAELDRCSDEKRVWFLAPTVALCEQQHRYIQSRLPETSPLILLGSSNLDSWSEQHIWDAVLYNHRIVISTHTVLLDALRHAFVKLTNLALLVFDEAHHCAGKHAANLIMKEFYHEEKSVGKPWRVPHILGLSASPVRGSNVKEMSQVEINLDSICVTPRVYRQEMLSHVHRPQFDKIQFSEDLRPLEFDSPLITLRQLQQQMADDMESLLCKFTFQETPVISPRPFEPGDMKRWKRMVEQYRRKAESVYAQLGPWATYQFIQKTNELYVHETQASNNVSWRGEKVLNHLLMSFFEQSSREYEVTPTSINEPNALSEKANKLVDLIAKQPTETTIGLIFVSERVIVSLLFRILSTHPQTAARFNFATFVGLSNSSKKTIGIHDLLDLDSQKFCLDAFRAKKKHIVIATDVLEEGIDVAACNFVVCFDPPVNLKSFIQRRGRARKQQSRFIIMEAWDSAKTKLNRWVQLEEEITRMCQDEERSREAVSLIEYQDEDMDLILRHHSTGAVLTADSVKAHLHHFCDTLQKQPFVDTQPNFIIREVGHGLLTARVTLPNCVGSFRRSYFGSRGYKTERAAFKAAAFECYRALHEAEFVNGHFLPSIPTLQGSCQDLQSLIKVDEQMQPWRQMAHAWSTPELHKITFQIEGEWFDGCPSLNMSIITPMAIPPVSSLILSQHVVVTMNGTRRTSISVEDLSRYRQEMESLKLPGENQVVDEGNLDFVYVFEFEDLKQFLRKSTTVDTDPIARNPLETKIADNTGLYKAESQALALSSQQPAVDGCEISGTIESTCQLTGKMSAVELNASGLQEGSPSKATYRFNGSARSKVHELASQIVGHVEKFMVATRLQTSFPPQCKFRDTIHVVTAITAPSVGSNINFERYEFLGDAVLRMAVSAQVFASRVCWPAGWLSQFRDNLVSNNSLANAALSLKIDQYILTKAPRTSRWTVPRISDAEYLPIKRKLSSKTLADVSQALFAAAYLDSGYGLAKSWIEAFIPEVQSDHLAFQMPQSALYPRQEMGEAQQLIGYQFCNITGLLQALTHPSCASHGSEESYQRLAFLGDAVLKFLITKALFRHHGELPEGRMTEIRAALLNSNMLGYVCMLHSTPREVFDIEKTAPYRKIRRIETVQLWKYMRHESQDLVGAQKACYRRYQHLRDDLHNQFKNGRFYPWITLAKLQPELFYADMIQSVLGAIYVDSGADWTACQRFVDTIGITSHMERMLQADYEVAHPRSILQQLAPSADVRISRNSDGSFRGTVKIHEVEVEHAIAESCRSKKQAEILASHRAVQILAPDSGAD